ncbi:hypothetical protein ACJA29_03895 [Metamycoplasma sualvi]|uniref:hypothetical protein n=1 Tax=Metamycoplasma sualvi TaxID=2125 RepID=UPI003872EF91
MKKNTKRSILKSSIATTLALASVSPIAIALGKQIADNYQNQLFINSSRQAQNWTEMSNINIATKEMFHNTENLVPLSSVGRGQMVTPYGWLGKYNARTPNNPGANFTQQGYWDYWSNTLALVGWDGSIIWTNDESGIAIYSAKYNFATNTIFVVRTQDPTGAGGLNTSFNPDTSDPSFKITFTIHDATTGKILYNSYKDANDNISWAFNNIFSRSDLKWNSNEFKKDLYYQDMITLGNGDIIWYYTPNILKMRESTTSLTLQKFSQQVWGSSNNQLAKFFLIKKSEIDAVRNGNSSTSIRPIDISNNVFNSFSYSSNDNRYLLTSPIVIPGTQDNEFNILSFVVNGTVIESHNTLYKVENGSCSKKNNSTTGLTLNELSVYTNTNNSNISTFWTANNWSNEFNKAFLLPTRNMFDERVITFAYPYASPPNSSNSSSVSLPIFNVFQMGINSADASNVNSVQFNNLTKSFNFGEKIVNHYIDNNLATKNPYSEPNILKWYPWPNAINSSTTGANDYANYTEQLYSRLISVSPFDNTIIYASRPNYKHNVLALSNNKDVFSGYSSVETSYASFWIGNSTTGQVSNFFIPNFNTTYGTISNQLVASTNTNNTNNKSGGIYDIYKNGFWFDVNSLTGQSGKLNLYFPTTGTKKNAQIPGADNNVKSTPIAFISPTLSNYVAMDSLINNSNSFNKTTISNESFTNYITSRADLNQWFPRTYQNLTKGANAYGNGAILNDYDVNSQNRAVATSLNRKLTDATWFGANNKSVELFSNWQVGSTSSYNSMAVKRAKIVTKINTSDTASTALKVELQFILENSNNWNNPFIASGDKAKVTTFSYPVTISNASWQLLDSWSTNVRLSTFRPTNGQNKFNVRLPITNHQSVAQGTYGGTFGTHNLGYWTRSGSGNNYTWNAVRGDTLQNNVDTPLWVEFGIDYNPNGNADPTWIQKLESFDNGLFTKTYPVVDQDTYTLPQGATSFNTVLDKFIKWKAENLMYGTDLNNPTNNIYSPGQICIKAYLKLNPYFKNNSNNTIYTMPADTNGTVVQAFYDSTNDIRYVYRDEYQGSRVVYKQTSPNFDNNSEYGFGLSVNSEINKSWETIPVNNKFTAYLTQQTNISDILVRDGQTATTDKMFSAEYSADMSSIILTPKSTHLDWIKKRFGSFNQMVGRYVKFQYLLDGQQDQWQDFNSNILTDSNAKNMFNSGSYTIPNSNGTILPNNIQKVRFILNDLPNDNQYNSNKIVSSSALSNNRVFVSDAIPLDQIPIHIDYERILNNVAFDTTGANSFLLGSSHFTSTVLQNAANSYQTSVLSSISLKDKIELKYSLDPNATEENYYDASELFNKLKEKYENYSDPDQGIIDIWTTSNTSGNTKIYVKVVVKEAAKDKYEIIEQNQNKNYVQETNIKFFLNLSNWFSVLRTQKTNVILDSSAPNTISSFTPPAMTGAIGQGFLFGKSYDDIVALMVKFGISIEYQKNNNTWTSNKNEITSYDPNVRKIKIRITNSNNIHNVALSPDGINTSELQEIDLILNVPILINLQEGTKNNFIRKDHISGNTWKIEINESKEQTIINDIKSDGNSQWGSDSVWQELTNYLEIQYALSNVEPSSATTFYNRQELIDHLQTQTETNYNNIIWARLHVKKVEGEEVKFILTTEGAKPFKMNGDSNNPSRNKILIYVQAAKYEQELNNIEVSGSTGNLLYSYPEVIQKVVDASSNSSNDLGIKIQYSLKQDITYSDNSGGDISNGWVDTAPTSVPAGTSSIKVRIVVTDSNKYIYGMGSSSGGPSVHSIDLNNISSLIDVDSNWFNEVSLTIANSGYLKDIQESDITTWKDSILNKSTALQTDSSLKNKVEIKFQIEGNNNWYIARDLVITLKSMINDYSGVNLGIIYLWDGTRGLKINAKFEKKNESDKIIFVSSLNSTNPNTNLEGQVQTNQVKTYIDLSSYINVLKSNKTSVVLQNGQAGTIQSFTPPAMTGNVGSGFLHGKTYDEIANRLQTLGITFKFNNNMDNNWNRKENVNTYN